MPGTGHSARYKSCISNRVKISPFEQLAKWNQDLLGADGMIPSITGGGGSLEFKKLNASDIDGVMSNPANTNLVMNNLKIDFGTQHYTIGENSNGQFFIKRDSQNEVLGLNSPSFLIDNNNGDVHIKGVKVNTTPSSGHTFKFSTNGTSQGDREALTFSTAASGAWVDLTNALVVRFNGAADNNAPVWSWTTDIVPSGQWPNNQGIYNTTSVLPGNNIADAFRASSTLAAGQKLPVVCTLTGAFLASPTAIPTAALIWPSGGQFYYDPAGGSNGARFTHHYTLTVGIVKRVWNGTSLQETNVASHDISIPFREGFYSRTADFSCSFHFSMEYEDANGHAVEYAPYYNHNGWISSSNQTAHLRRNGHFTVTFVTGLNHS